MFPMAHSQIYYNEAGEPLGWDEPVTADSFYCGECGFNHTGPCPDPDPDDLDDLDEDRRNQDGEET